MVNKANKANKEQDEMLAVSRHPFESGLLDHISTEMDKWVYFLGHNDAAKKVIAAIIVKSADEFRNGSISSTGSKINLFDPNTYIRK